MRKIISIIPDSDRIIFTEWNEQELISVNFMQGAGDIEHFNDFKKNDENLRKFVQKNFDEGTYAYENDICAIDSIIEDFIYKNLKL